ncbi:hypothetical protein [Salinispora vitiensis]|uniref:hypothetical protein n=1 Tax=Salinispora vitiensis TaxID=999544 RepID=UPI00037CD338|nr:hypothetical protein [Salinispora vitiensis]
MSTNYYVRIANTPDDGEGIHLGQHAAGTFTFRAHPDRNVTDYEAWLNQLDQGEIVAESGYTVTRDEMVAIAAKTPRTPWAECGATHSGGDGYYDLEGRRWLAVDFC